MHDDSEPLFTFCSVTTPPIMLTVKVNSLDLEMELDMGTSMTLISEQIYNQLWTCSVPPMLKQYTCPQIISWDPISLGFLVYIDAVCRL